ncbi:caspase family protein [Bradyrhizobium sp. JYMT SZCCT0180]|uniref:caspase family protein n=1 Tax=Bradyrhizobium sp. JYMT SZCCT0180 TaxID=2807666 RepID=UPI001BABAFDF|nr:caspase family protein [Bradyrhizobium sp. JYMT SZCCT0180]MBR1213173.1 caspase family protein [Bradyrhizobium sp. JYMT SZCCT0180]
MYFRMSQGWLRLVFWALIAGLLQIEVASGQPAPATIDPFNNRHALVIGNGAYRSSPLKNPVNDATDMAAALRSVGFKVTLGNNLDIRQMRLTIQQFVDALPTGAAAFVFYAGHGVQHGGQNYLLPVDAVGQVSAPRDLDRVAITVSDLLRDLEGAKPAITVIFLDACRDSPFSAIAGIESGLARTVPRASKGTDQGKSAGDARANLEGVLISYSTAPNSVAADGSGRNSPYTTYLKKYIASPNTTLETILKSTRSGVTKDSQGRQTPWYESSINGDFFPAGSDQISIEALVGMFLPDRDQNFVQGATYMMAWDPAVRSPIKWHHAGLKTGSNLNDVKLETMSSSWTAPFSRTGDVIITVDGEPTHTVLERTRKPVRWKVTLLGARNGALVVGLDNNVWSQEFGGFGGRQFLSEDKTCRKETSTVYAVNLQGKIPAWLGESRSCGSAGCGYDYQLFTDRRDKSHFGCR